MKGSGDDSKWKKIKETKKTSERSETNAGEDLLVKRTSRAESKSDSRRKETSSLAKQNKIDDAKHKSQVRTIEFESKKRVLKRCIMNA